MDAPAILGIATAFAVLIALAFNRLRRADDTADQIIRQLRNGDCATPPNVKNPFIHSQGE